MGALLFIRDLADRMHDIRTEAQILDSLHHARLVEQRIDEEDRAFCKRRHLAQRRLHRRMADLRGDGEEELATLGHLTFHPHIALHQRHQALRDGKPETGTTVFLTVQGVSEGSHRA